MEGWQAVGSHNDATAGLVLLAGSALPPKSAQPMHTGAGRIVTRRMRPLAISERLARILPQHPAAVIVLMSGALPMAVLETKIDNWIVSKGGKA